jgi:hypothetical protein
VGGKIPESARRWAAEQLCGRGDIEEKHEEIKAAFMRGWKRLSTSEPER